MSSRSSRKNELRPGGLVTFLETQEMLRPHRPYRHISAFDRVLGTSFELVVDCDSSRAGIAAEDAALCEIDRLEHVFSAYKDTSELNEWQKTFGKPEPVSRDLAHVLSASENWRRRTGGAFLPTVESAVIQYRKAGRAGGVDGFEPVLLETEDPLWEVDLDRLTATRLTRHHATLNAIAKGYILDVASSVSLSIEGVRQVLLNIGGDLRHRVHPRSSSGRGRFQKDKDRVRVGITDPDRSADNLRPIAHVELRGDAVATSGGYRRGIDVHGHGMPHLMDPLTSRPARSQVTSASVIAPTAMDADAAATALCVMPERYRERFLVENSDLAVCLVFQNGDTLINEPWRHRQS